MDRPPFHVTHRGNRFQHSAPAGSLSRAVTQELSVLCTIWTAGTSGAGSLLLQSSDGHEEANRGAEDAWAGEEVRPGEDRVEDVAREQRPSHHADDGPALGCDSTELPAYDVGEQEER